MNSNPVGTEMSDAKISPFKSTHVGEKMLDPKTLTLTNGLVKTQRKSAKTVRTRGSGVRPKFVRLIIEQI